MEIISQKAHRFMFTLLFVTALITIYIILPSRPILFVNGHILTMDHANLEANAILVGDGMIVAVGDNETVESEAPWYAERIDLKGKTMVPGFVDAHSHFPASGLSSTGLDLTPVPIGEVANMSDLLRKVQKAAQETNKDNWIVGFNYDDASLGLNRHPLRQELDAVAPDHAVYLWHRSGHMGVANTKALLALGYSDDLKDNDTPALAHPPQRNGMGQLTGLLQEDAAPKMATLLREMSVYTLYKAFSLAKSQYLRAGYTTVQNGYADKTTMRLLRWAQRLGMLAQRVVVWPADDKIATLSSSISPALQQSQQSNGVNPIARRLGWKENSTWFSLPLVKLISDGSPQGRTAWLSKPYLASLTQGGSYRGKPSMPPEVFTQKVISYHASGVSLAIHGNGDAAIDLIIKSLRQAQDTYPRNDVRHVLVHGQTIRQDQLVALTAQNVTVSFFPNHTFFWGDWYVDNILGHERAMRISPLAWANDLGQRFTIHSDSPVTPIDAMLTLWAATTRQTLQGQFLDQSLAVSRMQGLRALTIDSAWQNRLEDDRGSLEVGKLADLVVLSDDPLSAFDVRKIEVEGVYVHGLLVYQLDKSVIEF